MGVCWKHGGCDIQLLCISPTAMPRKGLRASNEFAARGCPEPSLILCVVDLGLPLCVERFRGGFHEVHCSYLDFNLDKSIPGPVGAIQSPVTLLFCWSVGGAFLLSRLNSVGMEFSTENSNPTWGRLVARDGGVFWRLIPTMV
jgi:hypothetical protein